jgi:hypothetical protein
VDREVHSVFCRICFLPQRCHGSSPVRVVLVAVCPGVRLLQLVGRVRGRRLRRVASLCCVSLISGCAPLTLVLTGFSFSASHPPRNGFLSIPQWNFS